jgi:hypothetical protein
MLRSGFLGLWILVSQLIVRGETGLDCPMGPVQATVGVIDRATVKYDGFS